MGEIHFFEEDISFDLSDLPKITSWLERVATEEHFDVEEINYIFCSDEYLLKINREYLDHDYYTDIITFDNSDLPTSILADIFISIERVSENAQQLEVPFEKELQRVMVHGLLHLMGYQDKSDDDKILMRQKEDACLTLLK